MRKFTITALLIYFILSISFAENKSLIVRKKMNSLKSKFLKELGAKNIKTRTKIHILKYEDVDAQISRIVSWIKNNNLTICKNFSHDFDYFTLKFYECFKTKKADAFFPLTNSVLKISPEESLKGIDVYDKKGYLLGKFSNIYPYSHHGERTYTLYFFQYLTPANKLERSGTNLLFDRFLVKWADIREKIFVKIK